MSLVSLIYVSSATHPLSTEALVELLKECRVNNTPKQVTGMLLYRDGYFLQVLEGEREVVESLYADIAKDPRHAYILRIATDSITERAFPDWAMGFKDLDKLTEAELEGFSHFLDEPFHPETFTNDPNRARRMLESFKEGLYF